MVTVETRLPSSWTVADLQQHLGWIPAERIRLFPYPGTATVEDALVIGTQGNCLCELIDGTLVEKAMGWFESFVAMRLVQFLNNYLETHPCGVASGPDGLLQLFSGQVRIPDVAFISNERLPGGEMPRDPAPEIVPDLAVEVISSGNTPQEMERKLHEYFENGVRMVWYVDPEAKTVTVHHSAEHAIRLNATESLRGEPILDGFEVPIRLLFERPGQSD